MAALLRIVLYLVVIFVGPFSHSVLAEDAVDRDQSGQVTLLESFKFAQGDTLWRYWNTNARTREMYRGDWKEFLQVVSQFNAITEWRTVQPQTVVHIPLPTMYAIGFSVKNATSETVTVVLEQSAAGQGFYRIKELAKPAELIAPSTISGNREAVSSRALAGVRTEILRAVEQETEVVRRELTEKQIATDARFDQQRGWLRNIFFLFVFLIAAVVVAGALSMHRYRVTDDRRGIEILARRLVEQERLRVSLERELEDERNAHRATKKDLTDVERQITQMEHPFSGRIAEGI